MSASDASEPTETTHAAVASGTAASTGSPGPSGGGDGQSKIARPRGRRGFRMPHVYVVLFFMSALAALATYVIPASQYARVPGPNGREVVDPQQYAEVASTPTSVMEFLTAIPRGLMDASEVVFFTFVVGGVFMVIRSTGIIEVALDRLSRSFSRRRILLIPLLISVFAALATLIGTQELSLVYIPVLLPIVIALGFDSVTAVAIALIGTTAGFSAGVLNPINTGLAQQIAGLPTFSGAGLRLVALVLLVAIGSLWTMRYASRVVRDPAKSLMAGDDQEAEKHRLYRHELAETAQRLNRRQGTALVLALPILAVTVWGVMTQGWFMIEMAGMFILLMLVVGLVGGLRPSELAGSFSTGMRDVLEGAIIVGVARSVAVVLEDGQILDTLVHALGQVVSGLPPVLSAVGMLVVQTLFNFVVPSGSGQAVVTMPVMAPLSDLIDVTRQTSVLAFQLGDGPSNILYPTSGYFMAALAIGGVRWEKWIRFYLPVFGMWFLVAVGLLVYAQIVGWNG